MHLSNVERIIHVGAVVLKITPRPTHTYKEYKLTKCMLSFYILVKIFPDYIKYYQPCIQTAEQIQS